MKEQNHQLRAISDRILGRQVIVGKDSNPRTDLLLLHHSNI
jgi:hypothetical protein